MAGIDFFSGGAAPDPNADPQGFMRAQNMARALMVQGVQSPQGQNVGGHYVAPSPLQYVNQLGSAVAGGAVMRGLNRSSAVAAANNSADPIGSLGQAMSQQNGGLGGWIRGLLGGGG